MTKTQIAEKLMATLADFKKGGCSKVLVKIEREYKRLYDSFFDK